MLLLNGMSGTKLLLLCYVFVALFAGLYAVKRPRDAQATETLESQILPSLGCGETYCNRVKNIAHAAIFEPTVGLQQIASIDSTNGDITVIVLT